MLSIKFEGQPELLNRLKAMPDTIREALVQKVTELTLRLEALVKTKLSGDVLNVRTGALRSSIYSRVYEEGKGVYGKVVSPADVPYAQAHEFGAHIPERFPVNAKALHFYINGQEVFAKKAAAFELPERSFLRSSLDDMKDEITVELKQVIEQAVNKK